MKYLLVLVVVGVMAWLLLGRRRTGSPPEVSSRRSRDVPAAPAEMAACAHCGLHLPASEALRDAQGRPYCGDAHRRAGPR